MTTSLSRGANRFRLFNHWCHPLAELKNVATTPRNWISNKWSQCDFSLGYDYTQPQIGQFVREDWLSFGNLVLIEHIPSDTGHGKLPDWVGVLLPTESWNENEYHGQAYSAEEILDQRYFTPQKITGSPAQCFTKIIQLANAAADNIQFRLGVVDDKAFQYSRNMSLSAYGEITQLIGAAGMDWNVTPFVNDKGDLELIANLYARRGIDTGFTLTNTNTELVAPLLERKGIIVNHKFGYSHEQTSQARQMREGRNQESIDRYGEFQSAEVYAGIQSASVVERAAQSYVDVNGFARTFVKRNALDMDDTFNWCDIGNILHLHETRVGFNPNGGYGFDADLKILTMEYNDLTNKVVMNVEVI